MKHKSLILACLMVFALVLGMSSAASAYTFSLEATSDSAGTAVKTKFDPGEVFYLNIKLDNAGGVAGCAFTLEYPSNVLTPPTTDSEGISSGITSPFPFTYNTDQTHRGNSSEAGKIYLAGAAINTTDGGSLYSSGGVTLFRIRFTVRADAVPGSFNVTLKQTVLLNLDAGYDNDPVTVLVGAVPNTDVGNWGDLSLAFPDLMPTPPSPLAQAPLYTNDGDSIDDAWELAQFGDLTTADDTTDYDGDGYLDRYEQPAQFGGNGTNPKVQDPPYIYPNYNASTDTRGPYQVVGPDPLEPFAGAGDSFDMDVYYFTSDGAQNLAGLSLRIHYDSTKLTWNGFSDVLAIGLGTPSATPQNDTSNFDGDTSTDKYLVVPWSGGNWPGETCTEESPLMLYTVNFTVAGGLDEGDTSNIKFSAGSVAAGYTFTGIPAEFEVRILAPGDVNGDNEVNVSDVLMLIDFIFQVAQPDPSQLVAADLDASGVIDITDLLMMIDMSFNP